MSVENLWNTASQLANVEVKGDMSKSMELQILQILQPFFTTQFIGLSLECTQSLEQGLGVRRMGITVTYI
jgi:hypothetical protein